MNRPYITFLLYSITYFSFTLTNVSCQLEGEDIVGGKNAAKNQFSYQVSIQANDKHLCGGGIIAQNYVISGASCYINAKTNRYIDKPYKVVAGTSNLNDGTGVKVDVETIYIPTSYLYRFANRHNNDIALLKLKENLDTSQYQLSAVGLPKNNESLDGKIGKIAGFGWDWANAWINSSTGRKYKTIEGGNIEGNLKWTDVKIISANECNKKFPEGYQIDDEKQFCGYMMRSNNRKPEGTCLGDSGPLIIDNIMYGILSTGPPGCDESEQPAKYTRVSTYIPFIISAAKGEESEMLTVYSVKQHN